MLMMLARSGRRVATGGSADSCVAGVEGVEWPQ